MSKKGVILAGGMGTRLAEPSIDASSPSYEASSHSSDRATPLKPWAMLAGKSLLHHAYDRLAPQVDEVFFSAPKNFDEPTLLGCQVIRDMEIKPLGGSASSRRPIRQTGGPLVGVASVLQYFHGQGEGEEIITVPVDMPFLPRMMVAQLAAVPRAPDQPCYAFCEGRDFPTCAIWPVSLAPQLINWVVEEDMRALYKALRRFGALRVDFAEEHKNEFLNINSPKDLEKAQTLIETGFGVNEASRN